MRDDRIEAKWIEIFAEVFRLSAIGPDEPVVILSETQSRALNVHLAELALARIGARACHVTMPTPRQAAPVPVRSRPALRRPCKASCRRSTR